jgi:hypothetical protein
MAKRIGRGWYTVEVNMGQTKLDEITQPPYGGVRDFGGVGGVPLPRVWGGDPWELLGVGGVGVEDFRVHNLRLRPRQGVVDSGPWLWLSGRGVVGFGWRFYASNGEYKSTGVWGLSSAYPGHPKRTFQVLVDRSGFQIVCAADEDPYLPDEFFFLANYVAKILGDVHSTLQVKDLDHVSSEIGRDRSLAISGPKFRMSFFDYLGREVQAYVKELKGVGGGKTSVLREEVKEVMRRPFMEMMQFRMDPAGAAAHMMESLNSTVEGFVGHLQALESTLPTIGTLPAKFDSFVEVLSDVVRVESELRDRLAELLQELKSARGPPKDDSGRIA